MRPDLVPDRGLIVPAFLLCLLILPEFPALGHVLCLLYLFSCRTLVAFPPKPEEVVWSLGSGVWLGSGNLTWFRHLFVPRAELPSPLPANSGKRPITPVTSL